MRFTNELIELINKFLKAENNKMKTKRSGSKIIVRLDKGEEIIESPKQIMPK